MIRHLWTILCARCILEANTNSVSLIDVLENVTVSTGGQPAFQANWSLVTDWRRQDESLESRGRARIELIAPSGETIGSSPVEYDIDLATTDRARAIVAIPLMPIRGEGRYLFRISLQTQGEKEWREVFDYPLVVTLQLSA